MLSGEPRLYSKFSDGVIVEGGHFLVRRRSLLRLFRGQIVALDPRTPAFQGMPQMAVDPRTEKIRSTYLKLAASHGGPIWRRFSHLEAIKPRDFAKPSCELIASRLMDLQRPTESDLLLPPYFIFQDIHDAWLQVSLCMYESMHDLSDGMPLYLPVAFDHQLLQDKEGISRVCELLSTLQPEGYAVWPVGLDERRAPVEELEGLNFLLKSLPGPSLLLYAGYFSMLLCALNGSSFSNGPCFYEKRDITIAPPLHFRPKCGYYLPELFQKVGPVSAVVFYRLLSDMGIDPSLCPACLRNLNGGGFDGIASMPDLDVFEHNLMARSEEIKSFKSSTDPLYGAIKDLRWVIENRKSFSQFLSLRYVETWLNVLERIYSNP